MAKEKQESKQTTQDANSKLQLKGKNKKSGILFSLLAFLVALLIMVVIVGAVAFLIVHNNVNNIAEKNRKQIEAIPIIRLALPKIPDEEDPDQFTEKELRVKYREIRKQRDDLKEQLENAEKEIAELKKSRDEMSKALADKEKEKQELMELRAQLEKEKKQNEEDKQKIDELVANGNKEGFKEFFEKIDKETAERLYAEILKEQKASDNAKSFAQIYESMDPDAAARIFEQLGDSKIDFIAETLKNMKKETSAEILAAMKPEFASKATEKLSELYKNQ